MNTVYFNIVFLDIKNPRNYSAEIIISIKNLKVINIESEMVYSDLFNNQLIIYNTTRGFLYFLDYKQIECSSFLEFFLNQCDSLKRSFKDRLQKQ